MPGQDPPSTRAAVYRRYGPPEVVRVMDVPKPAPRDNQVLIRVHATTVSAADWRMRRAVPFVVRLMTGWWRPKKIQILGMEFSGTVEAAGRAVTRFRPGEAVFGSPGFRFGAHAEYICLAEDELLAIKPAPLSFEEAAAVLFGGVSALFFVRKARIELAKLFGAHVTAVCSTGNVELVRALGADAVVDYTREDFASGGRVYDVVIDTVGKSGFARSLRALKRGGCYVRVGGSGRMASILWGIVQEKWAAATGAARVTGGVGRGTVADVNYLRDLIEAGRLRTVIDRRYSLADIAEAHRYVEKGHKKGHVVVLIAPAGE
jgi:NADPH:quinone reductase-like Zn-dependent oxidoreductase